jgi:RHS repeat-associated protein
MRRKDGAPLERSDGLPITGATFNDVHYIVVNGEAVATFSSRSDAQKSTRYLHRDHLGSVTRVTSETGSVVDTFAYDAWGARRNPGDWNDYAGQPPLPTLRRPQFTGHERLHDIGIVHMNGRIYDPKLGRVLSADPYVQSPGNAQSYNRDSLLDGLPYPQRLSRFDDATRHGIRDMVYSLFAVGIMFFVGWFKILIEGPAVLRDIADPESIVGLILFALILLFAFLLPDLQGEHVSRIKGHFFFGSCAVLFSPGVSHWQGAFGVRSVRRGCLGIMCVLLAIAVLIH